VAVIACVPGRIGTIVLSSTGIKLVEYLAGSETQRPCYFCKTG
jgi:hypothetical protein